MNRGILVGGIANPREVEKGEDPIRVPIRPIICADCGARRVLGYNIADTGLLDESMFQTALEVSVCDECVQNYAELPEGGWEENPLKKAIELCNTLLDKTLKKFNVETIEELNDEDGLETLEQELANGLVAVLGLIEDAYLPHN